MGSRQILQLVLRRVHRDLALLVEEHHRSGGSVDHEEEAVGGRIERGRPDAVRARQHLDHLGGREEADAVGRGRAAVVTTACSSLTGRRKVAPAPSRPKRTTVFPRKSLFSA